MALEEKTSEKPEIVFMFDFDGTILNTMHLHANLSSELMNKYFGMSIQEARKKYLDSSGMSFTKQMEKIFPNESPEKIAECIAEYKERRVKEVFDRAKPFPDIPETLSELKDQTLIVSSGNNEPVVDILLEREGFQKYFQRVYGPENGLKDEHIEKVLDEFSPNFILFFGDSPFDVQLSRENVITIGRSGDGYGLLSEEELLRMGADVVARDFTGIAKAVRELPIASREEMVEFLRSRK